MALLPSKPPFATTKVIETAGGSNSFRRLGGSRAKTILFGTLNGVTVCKKCIKMALLSSKPPLATTKVIETAGGSNSFRRLGGSRAKTILFDTHCI